jgi:hypothetical protein
VEPPLPAQPSLRACASLFKLAHHILELGTVDLNNNPKREQRIILNLLQTSVEQAQNLLKIISIHVSSLPLRSTRHSIASLPDIQTIHRLASHYSSRIWNLLRYPSKPATRCCLYKYTIQLDELVHNILPT